jgi:hypothetical protein
MCLDTACTNMNNKDGGEGSVVYLTGKRLGSDKNEVISVFKLKTLEYLFYRRLREELKILYNNKLIGQITRYYYLLS